MQINEFDSVGTVQDSQKCIVKAGTVRPSQKDVDEHMVSHVPFRSWCLHCIKGKSMGKPHFKKSQVDESACVPCVCMDYMFMSSQESDQEVEVNEEEELFERAFGQ